MKPAIILLFGPAIFVFSFGDVFAQGRGSPCELVCRPPAVIDAATARRIMIGSRKITVTEKAAKHQMTELAPSFLSP